MNDHLEPTNNDHAMPQIILVLFIALLTLL